MSAAYVDDYILAAVENPEGSALQRTGRAALHTIHGLFPPPDRSGHVNGKDPISIKKLESGDKDEAHETPNNDFLDDYVAMAPLAGDSFAIDTVQAVHTFLVDIILGNDTAEAKIQELQRSKRSNNGREAYKLLQFVLCWRITPTHVVGSVRATSQKSEPLAPTMHT
jgi:hypothetical protein